MKQVGGGPAMFAWDRKCGGTLENQVPFGVVGE